MELHTEKIGDIAIVAVQTDVIDAGNAGAFKDAMSPILDGNKKVVLDMRAVGFLDSSGCGTVLSCLRQLTKAGGDLKMFGVQKPVRTLFELIRMHRIIEIFNSKEEAVKSF